MSTAIIISGQMRSFAKCLPNLRWMVFRHFHDPFFFVSCCNDEQAESAELLRKYYPRVYIEKIDQPQLPEPDNTLSVHAPYAISVPVQAVIRQIWHLNRAWEFHREFAEYKGKFDTYVRIRPDLWFLQYRHQKDFITAEDGKRTEIQLNTLPNDARVPWWGSFGGINDRFAVVGVEAAKHYFTAYSKLAKLLEAGCPLHPESLIAASLEDGGCEIKRTLIAEFRRTTKTGELAWPEHQHSDIFSYMEASR